MKKNLLICFGFCIALWGCKKESALEVTLKPVDVTANTPTAQVMVTWTIQAHDGGKTGKTAGMDATTVSILGAGGTVETKTTDATGMVAFTSVPQGIVSGYAKKDGYTTINFTADLRTTVADAYNGSTTTRMANTDIMLWPLTGGLSGICHGDWDHDGLWPPESDHASNTDTTNVPQPRDIKLNIYCVVNKSTFSFLGVSSSPEAGALIDLNIENGNITGTAVAGTGKYTFTGLPGNDANAGLKYTISSAQIILEEIKDNKRRRYFHSISPITLAGMIWPGVENEIDFNIE